MQKEFLEPGALLEDTKEKRKAFRIAVFGTGSDSSIVDQTAVAIAKHLARDLAEQSFPLSTGGQDSGVMKAVTDAAAATIRDQGDNPAEYIKAYPTTKTTPIVKDAEVVVAHTLPERLRNLIDDSKAFIVIGGGLGTMVEVVVAIHTENIKLRDPSLSPRPCIIIDPSMDQKRLTTLQAMIEEDPRKSRALAHTYYLTAQPGNEQKAEKILALYYKRFLGAPLEESEETFLHQNNFQYLYRHWSEISDDAGFHL